MGIYPIQYCWVNTNKGKEKQLCVKEITLNTVYTHLQKK